MTTQELQTVLAISRTIATVRKKSDLLQLIIEQLQPLFNGYDCGLFVFNRDKTTLEDLTVSLPTISPSAGNQLLADDQAAFIPYQGSVFEWVFERLRAANAPFIHNYKEDQVPDWVNYVQAPVIDTVGYEESMVAVLQIGGDEIGLFMVNSLQKGTFQKDQYILFQAVADQVAAAMANILANEEILEREREKATLLTISGAISSARNAVELLSVIRQNAQQLIPFYDTGILIVEPDGLHHYDLSVNMPGWDASASNQELHAAGLHQLVHPGSYVAFAMSLMEERKSPIIENWQQRFSEFDYPFFPIMEELGFEESLATELKLGGKVFGTFWLNSLEKNHFHPHQFDIFQALADQVAVALANILANEEILKREREKTVLLAISNAIATINDKRQLLKLIFEQVRPMFCFDDIGLNILEPDGQHYNDWAAQYTDTLPLDIAAKQVADHRYPYTGSLIEQAVHDVKVAGHPLVYDLTDELVAQWSDAQTFLLVAMADQQKQALVTTLQTGGKLLGLLNINTKQAGHYATINQPVFQAIADQVAVAVANILANEEILQREREKEVLLQITQAIAAVNDKVTLLRTIFDLVHPIFKFDDLGLAILTDDKQHVDDWSASTPGLSDSSVNAVLHTQQLARMEYPGTLLEHTIKQVEAQGQPLLIALTDELAAQWPDAVYLPIEIEHGQKECLFTNLKTGGRLLGSFNLNSKQAGYFATTDHRLFQAIADQVAVAVANILANEEIREREQEKSMLLSISQQLSTIRNQEDLFDRFIHQLNNQLPFNEALVVLYDESIQTRRYLYNHLPPPKNTLSDYQYLLQKRLPVDGSPYEEIVTYKQPQIRPRSYWDARYPTDLGLRIARDNGLVEGLYMPLYYRSQLLGTFTLYSGQLGRFTPVQLPLYSNLADQVAVAVANVLANEELLQRESEKTIQLAVSNALADGHDWDQKLLSLAKTIQPAIPFDYAIVGLETGGQIRHGYGFYRTGPDEYQTLQAEDFLRLSRLTAEQYTQMRQQLNDSQPLLLNGAEFEQHCRQFALKRLISETFRLQSHLLFPIPLTREGRFTLAFYSRQGDTYRPYHLDLGQKLTPTLALALDRLLAYEEVAALSQQLQQENTYLQEEVRTKYRFEEIVGTSQAVRDVFQKVSKVGRMNSTVLILGETGTGKELVARAIHQASPRQAKPLIKINCAALPAQLIESELFGHEKGAFTGAVERRIGKFELAHESTIFLDEIGELPLELQAKLLRAIQEKEIERLGSNKVIQTDVRVLAATNRNLEKEVAEGRFRSDLYFRLNVYPIKLPPLRERKEDITLLAIHFSQKLSKKLGKAINGFSNGAIKEMQAYHWPGNIRELEHVIERAAIESEGGTIRNLGLLKRPEGELTVMINPAFQLKSYADGERELIMNTVRYCNGRIRGTGGAAQLLQVKATTLEARMKKLGIKREFFVNEGAGASATS